MNLKKNIITLFLIVLLSACVGSSTSGIFGSGVSIALDPRTLGTQIDDSIMQKNLITRLTLSEKKYFVKISVKVLDGRIFLGGKVEEPEEKLNITKMNLKEKLSVSDVTVSKCYKKLCEHREKLFIGIRKV